MPREYCILALGTSGIAFGTNGAPKADLNGCNIMSNAGARCNGNNLGADYGDAAGTNDGCGVVQRSNVPPLADPYAGLSLEHSGRSVRRRLPSDGNETGFPLRANTVDGTALCTAGGRQ